MMRSLLGALLLVASVGACVSGPGEPAPPALRRYLEALIEGKPAEAYAVTSLADLRKSFGPGAAVTKDHFVAAWTANPLLRYEVVEVTRLDRRSIDDIDSQGSPFFEASVRLTDSQGSWASIFTIDGEVAGVVNVEATDISFANMAGASISVNGLAVSPLDHDANAVILVLQGTHEVDIDGVRLTLRVPPLQVLEGPASISPAGPSVLVLD